MPYAEVAVAVPAPPGKAFSYSVPADLQVALGHAVQVPFGSRLLPGFVVALTAEPSFSPTRPISRVIDSEPWLTPHQIALARWVSEHTRSALYNAAAQMVPAAFRQKVSAYYEALPVQSAPELEGEQAELWRRLHSGPLDLNELQRAYGGRDGVSLAGRLIKRGLARRLWRWERPTVRPKWDGLARATGSPDLIHRELERGQERAPKRTAILSTIAEAGMQGVYLSDLRAAYGATADVLNALEERGMIMTEPVRVERDPLAGRIYAEVPAPVLSADQQAAWEKVSPTLGRDVTERRPWLIFGVTGSGKTELYLRALEKVVAQGRRGIVLVPEIALTPQTIERFSARFPNRVAVLHSELSPGEYFDEWWRIRQGEFDVVIGSRGAVFAPQPNLGLIVLDEEHERTYKQQENEPRYHAREVAVKRAELEGATLLLGSATPSLESYHRALSGRYGLVELPHRIVANEDGLATAGELAKVEVVDMREELKAGNRSIFSRSLQAGIAETLASGEQVILFLNRRGSSYVQCRHCGHVVHCRRCNTVMTYHADAAGYLRCHICNERARVPGFCPDCRSTSIRFIGLGTQRLEEQVALDFPKARLQRWDRDVTQGKDTHEEILRRFRNREADILIGTQMLAKGLHLTGVTLVGVVNADIGLNLPDFHAAERTFQILCQVAGRSGRGVGGGKVVIQSYQPDNYVIRAAAAQDFQAFYEAEIKLRAELYLPPYTRIVHLLYQHTDFQKTATEAARLFAELRDLQRKWGFPNVRLVGPAPAPIDRIRGRHRWHIVLKSPEPEKLLEQLELPEGWTIDVDPVDLL